MFTQIPSPLLWYKLPQYFHLYLYYWGICDNYLCSRVYGVSFLLMALSTAEVASRSPKKSFVIDPKGPFKYKSVEIEPISLWFHRWEINVDLVWGSKYICQLVPYTDFIMHEEGMGPSSQRREWHWIGHSGPSESSRFFGPELLLLYFPIIRYLHIYKSIYILSYFMRKSEYW